MTRILEACIGCPGWDMIDDREALRSRAKKAEARAAKLEAAIVLLLDDYGNVERYNNIGPDLWGAICALMPDMDERPLYTPFARERVERAHKLLKGE